MSWVGPGMLLNPAQPPQRHQTACSELPVVPSREPWGESFPCSLCQRCDSEKVHPDRHIRASESLC